MKTKLKASLEKTLHDWIDKHFEDPEWDEETILYPDIEKDFASIIELMLDSNLRVKSCYKEFRDEIEDEKLICSDVANK